MTADFQYEAVTMPIDELRRRLEAVAENFGDDGYRWSWDETRMHLEIRDPNGDPVATLHVEHAS